MSKELSIKKETRVVERTLSPREVAESILSVFKNTIKQAGSLKEDEYQLLFRKSEDQLKTYLSHLVVLAEAGE